MVLQDNIDDEVIYDTSEEIAEGGEDVRVQRKRTKKVVDLFRRKDTRKQLKKFKTYWLYKTTLKRR